MREMPKVIKKRAEVKPGADDDEVKSALTKLAEEARERQSHLIVGGIIALVIVVAVFGFFAYKKGAASEVSMLEYEGFKLYKGLPGATDMPESERMSKAAEKFTQAYAKRPSAYSLYFLGLTKEASGDLSGAMETFKRVQLAHADDQKVLPLAIYKLGMLAEKAGRMDEALGYFESIQNLPVDSLKDAALLEAGNVLELMGKRSDAADRYKTLTQQYPTSSFAREAKARLEPPKPAAGEKKPSGGATGALMDALSPIRR